MSLKTFFEDIFLKKDSIKSILDCYPDAKEKGFIFERCGDLLIKLGYLPIFSNDKYKHIIGKVNECKIEILKDFNKYIESGKCISGSSTGISDITLYDELEDKYIFISSKNYSGEPSVYDYDIAEIIAMVDDNKYLYKKYDIYLMVNDKNKLLNKVSKAHCGSKYITKYFDINKIIDLNDLEKAFFNMKSYLLKDNNIFKNFILDKKVMIPKFHQKLFEIKLFKQKLLNQKKFLLGLKCRAGKTFIVGFIISNDKNNYENFNILIITPVRKETSSQFLEMFENYIDFSDFNIINLNTGSMIDTLKFTKKNIIVTSKQLLQNYINNTGIEIIKNLNLNYIFFDESHYGGTTQLSTTIVNTYKNENTNLVFMTATFRKPLNHWNIPKECSFYWDLEDEFLCKTENINSLIMKHGDCVNEALNYFKSSENVLKDYEKMPNLELITTMFETDIFNNIKEKLVQNSSKCGFACKTLFFSNEKFNYEHEVELLLRYISGSHKEIDFPNGDKSIFGRIKEISLKKNSRTLLSNSNFTTQLWFLPFGIDQKINDVSQNLKLLMLKNSVLNKFEILVLNSNIDTPIKDIKHEIKKRELIGKDEGKRGLIVLVGNQCSLGITLELCDITILLNDILSADKIYQMMYRSMTEAPNKKCGFVVDLNINRVLNTVMEYSLYNKDLNIENKIKYIVENNLINIDSDYFFNKSVDEKIIMNNLLDIWKRDPINSIKKIMQNIAMYVLEINNNDDQKGLNNYFTKSFDENSNIQVNFFDEDDGQELKSGQTIKKENLSENDSDLSSIEDDKPEKKEDVKISLTKDILPFIIPLICFLTIKDNNKNFLEMLSMIKENEELLEIFNQQTYLWWNNSNIIDFIYYLTKKYIKENSDIYNSTIIIKMTLQSLIDKPKELLEFINDCLKPKIIEKKRYGEVFTPMPLINEMLDKLPLEVWSNPNLKWFDPAAGMGNFMIAIYFRLMEGLKDVIINDDERKRHILENMLYMSEINKKNCFIIKQIFDIGNKYKLNIYNGDTLLLDTKKEWNIEEFDIIIGNPPYNPDISQNNSKGQIIWPDFVKKSIELLKDNGLLLFIHPPNWRKPKHELHNLMFNNIQYLKILDEKKSEQFFHCKIRVDYYLLCKNNNKEFTTVIDEKNVVYEMNIKNLVYIPNYGLTIHKKIMDLEIDKIICINPRTHDTTRKFVKKNEDSDHIYKLLNTISSKGPTYYYSSKIHPVQNKNKVMFSNGRYIYPIYDNGTLGGTQSVLYIETKDNITGSNLINFINSNIFKFLIKTTKFNNFAISHEFISIIGDLSKLIEDINDLKINNYLKITELENKLINSVENNNDNDTISISSKSTTKSSKSTKSSNKEVILCETPLKKKGETCKNKASPECNGKCKIHFVLSIK